jgi:hypothetical protein
MKSKNTRKLIFKTKTLYNFVSAAKAGAKPEETTTITYTVTTHFIPAAN